MENKIDIKKISDFFDDDSQISKHNDNVYMNVNMDILDLYRFIKWIEDDLWEEEGKYEFNENRKESEMVELIRYNQKQAISLLRERLVKDMWKYFFEKELVGEEAQKQIDKESELRWGN